MLQTRTLKCKGCVAIPWPEGWKLSGLGRLVGLLLTEYVRYLQDRLLLCSVTSVPRLLRAVSCSFVYRLFLAFHTE